MPGTALSTLTDPKCVPIVALVAAVKDPFHYLQAYQGPPLSACNGWHTTPSVKAWFPQLPCNLPVSLATYTNLGQVNAAVRLLSIYYTAPNDLRTCAFGQGWYHPRGRARALMALASWAHRPGFSTFANIAAWPVTLSMQNVLLKVFNDPAGSRAGAVDTEVPAAAAEVVRLSRVPVFDAATWIPLWGWAVGGPFGGAAVRTRVFAMKAIQAILARGSLLTGQIRAADSLAAVLGQLVTAKAPSVPVGERDLYLSEAQATIGAAAQALVQAEMAVSGLAPTAPAVRVSSWVLPVVGAAVGVAALIGGAAFLVRRA